MSKDYDLKLDNHELDTLPTKIFKKLREAIFDGTLKPGSRLVQEELASSLGVSRMPVREALKRLETEGLIVIEPHRGAIVKPFLIEDIEEIYFLRSHFEKLAVEESVKTMDETVIQELENLVNLMDQSVSVEEFVQLNMEFHRLLISNCPWKRLLSFIETMWTGFPLQTPYLLPDRIAQSNKEHKTILQAVKSKDASLVANLISAHIARTGALLINNINNNSKDNC